ncbi:MAG: hypothetical protein IKK66_10145 [Ruminococcus sp.]|nr:hypothetical protein [Ruminococcus sp.]
MKSFRKITAWAMALAISSTATAVTAFAESNAVTTDVPAASELVTTDIVTTEAVITTTASTEDIASVTTVVPTTPVVSPVISGKFGTAEITVNTETKEVTVKDSATGMTAELKGSTINFDGSVIQTIDISNTELTDEQNAVLAGLLTVASSVKVDTLNFSDNVTEVKSLAIGSTMAENLTMVFGKNIKTIADDLLGESTAKVTIKGYKGTAAETFATSNNATFVALDADVSTQTTIADSAVTTTATTVTATDAATTKKATTASKKATTKKAATTAKASDSPKTGDSGVGMIAGVLALSAVTGAIALRKKDNE